MIDRILAAYAGSTYDFRATAKPDDTLAHLFEQWVPYYRMKAAISAVVRPATVLEIGVRHGYGAAAFLHGSPDAHYTGIDLDADSFGGEKGAIDWARRILPAGQHELIVADSQRLTRLPGGTYDLVHIDGQQDEGGTFHDLVLAVRQAKFILVDGYFWTEQNYTAVNDFLWRFREDIEHFLVIPGYAGEMLIKVKSPAAAGVAEGVPGSSLAIRDLYTTDYFLRNCGGWEFFASTRERLLHDGRLRSMADLMFAQPVRRVLDLGSGRGELTAFAALAGCEVVAVDYSPDAIRILRESLTAFPDVASRVQCFCADASTFDPPGAFDVVVAGDLVEHLTPPELEQLYARVAGALAPGGRFIVHTFPNRWFYDYAHRWRREAARRLGAHLPANPRSRFELLMHINEQSPRMLRRSLGRHFPEVCLWFGSPEDPRGSLGRRCRPRALAEYRDLFAVCGREPIEPSRLAALFASPALAEDNFPLELVAAPVEAGAARTITVTVRVTNGSREIILASRPPFPVYLSYRWLDAAGQPLPYEGWRNLLAPALRPGGSHVYAMQVSTPPVRGPHRLVFSLVQEHQFWLCDRRPDLCPGCALVLV